MGLIIKSTDNNKIKIKGYPFELEEVYCRVQMECLIDGITLNVYPKYFYNHQTYIEGNELNVNLPDKIQSLTVNKQTINDCLTVVKNYFETLGFEVIIED